MYCFLYKVKEDLSHTQGWLEMEWVALQVKSLF